jgi:hypothetical protein
MRQINVTSSSLAKYTGHNRYDTFEKILEELLIKNGIVSGYIAKSNLEADILKLPETSLCDLRDELGLSAHSNPTEIVHHIKRGVSLSTNKDITEDTSREVIDAFVEDRTTGEVSILSTLVPSIQKDIRMVRGCKKENENLNRIQVEKQIQIVERNSKMYTKELYRCDEYLIILRGRVDGQCGDTIIETKNRTKRLFKELRDYERVQLETYMFLTGLNKALLTEHYNDTSHCIEYTHDEEFWKECVEKTVQFMEDNVKPRFKAA